MTDRFKRLFLVLGILIICLLFSSCSANMAPNPTSAPQMPKSNTSAEAAPEAGNNAVAASQLNSRKLIVRVDAVLRVDNVSQRLNEVEKLALDAGGYVKTSYLSDGNGNITLMVPSGNMDGFMQKLESLGKVISKNKETEDVTDAYFDTQIRIKNLEAELDTFRQYLKKEGFKVSEILEIEREIRRLTDELELLKGQITNIDRQVKYSEVSLQFVLAQTDVPDIEKQDIAYKLKAAFSNGLEVLMNIITLLLSFIMFILPFVPIIIIIYLVWLIVIRPLMRKRKEKD